MSPDAEFGYHVEHSPLAIRPLSAEQLEALRAQHVCVLVTREYVVREGTRVVKEVVLDKGIH